MLDSVGFLLDSDIRCLLQDNGYLVFFGLSSSNGHLGRYDKGFKKKLTDIGLFCFSAIVGFETINYSVYQDCWI